MNFELLDTGPSFNFPFEVRVVGTGFDDRPSVIRRHCEKGMEVVLVREPNNSHDTNAIAVFLRRMTSTKRVVEEAIGYLPAPVAEELSDLMFRQVVSLGKCSVSRVYAEEDADAPFVKISIEGAFSDGVGVQIPMTESSENTDAVTK